MVLGLFMSRMYVCSKLCLFKSDRNHLKFKDLTQRCLTPDSADAGLALYPTALMYIIFRIS